MSTPSTEQIPIPIDHDSLKNDLYNAFRKSLTRDSMEDNREGFENLSREEQDGLYKGSRSLFRHKIKDYFYA